MQIAQQEHQVKEERAAADNRIKEIQTDKANHGRARRKLKTKLGHVETQIAACATPSPVPPPHTPPRTLVDGVLSPNAGPATCRLSIAPLLHPFCVRKD